MIDKICEVCKQPFRANYDSRRFCSKACRLKAGWNPKDPSKRSTFICEWCAKKFEHWTYRQPRFCSAQCRSEFAARQPKPHVGTIRLSKMCAYCGQQYQTNPTQVRLRNSNYCSRECVYAAMSEDRRGERNPNWTGGTADPDAYGPNWNRQRRRAKHRDKHTCQLCGYRSGGDRYLDVHHIIPIKKFKLDWKEANRLSNLISLCRFCHVEVEKHRIPCPTAVKVVGRETSVQS